MDKRYFTYLRKLRAKGYQEAARKQESMKKKEMMGKAINEKGLQWEDSPTDSALAKETDF